MRAQTTAGAVIELGTTETAPTIGITDYSRRVTDDFGVTTVVKRGFARRMSVRLSLPFDQVDAVQRQLADLRASSALWIADDRFAWLKVNGFYKDFELDLAVPPTSYCRLTVEGLTETEVVADAGGDPAPMGQASTLRLLKPSDGSVLVSSSVPETDFPEWAAGTTYGLQARVIKATTHRIYESTAAGNLGNDPATSLDKWIDIGPTNRWAMFDQALGTVTTATTSIVVTLTAGTAVALLDVTAATVRVQATGYDQTQAVSGGTMTFLDLPAAGGQITATISGVGQVSVGTLIVGTIAQLGVTEAAPTAGITDFSRKAVDDFGEVTVVQRAWAKRMTARALIRTDEIDRVANRIAGVRARPSLWIGQAGLESLTIYGFFKEFSIEVGETVSKLSFSIEGLSKAAPVAPPPTIGWENVVGRPSNLLELDPLAATDLAQIGADAWLHPAEKLIIQQRHAQLTGEQTGIVAQAAALSVSSSSYSDELGQLTSYLNALAPAWNDTLNTTAISRTVWDTNWTEFFNARQALLNAIDAKAATIAAWAGISTRPANLGVLAGTENINNNLVTMAANGAIGGAGGGQVTLPGIGFTGDSGATIGDNLIRNGDLFAGSSPWNTAVATYRVAGAAGDPAPFIFHNTSAGNAVMLQGAIRLSSGAPSFWYSYQVKSVATAAQQQTILYFKNAAGVEFSSITLDYFTAGTDWQTFSRKITPPPGAVEVRVFAQFSTGTKAALLRLSTTEATADNTAANPKVITGDFGASSGDNLIVNASLNDGLNRWSNITATLVAGVAGDPAPFYWNNPNTAPGNLGVYHSNSISAGGRSNLPASAPVLYYSQYVKGPAGRVVVTYMDAYNAAGAYISTTVVQNVAVPAGGTWSLVKTKFTPPVGATKFTLYWVMEYGVSMAVPRLALTEVNATLGATWGADVGARPGNLANLAGTEGINNSLITISESGALGGAGVGQVTIGGLTPGGLDNIADGTGFKRLPTLQRDRLLAIQDNATAGATWNTNVGARPGNLSELVGTEGLRNSLITLSAGGALGGAGVGQVTIGGLTPQGLDNIADGTGFKRLPTLQRDRLLAIQDNATAGATWNTNVGARPANLSELVGTEGLRNSLITLSAGGALGGAGVGQVTIGGLTPQGLDNIADGTGFKRLPTLQRDRLLAIEDNATRGSRVGTNTYSGDGVTLLSAAELMNDQLSLIEDNSGGFQRIRLSRPVAGAYGAATTSIQFGATVGANWGVNLAARPANLVNIVGNEGINNSLITMSSSGALGGAGLGQVTIGGLTPQGLDNIADGTTFKRFTDPERTKLSGTEAGATAGATIGVNLRNGATVVAGGEVLNKEIAYAPRTTYNFDGTTEGWYAQNANAAPIAGGLLYIGDQVADPIVRSPALSLAGSKNFIIRARIRSVAANVAWEGACYYETAGHGYTGSFYKLVPAPVGWSTAEWCVVEWDMRTLTAGGADYTSNIILSLRLDFMANPTGLEIDWITIGDMSVDAITARNIETNADVTSVIDGLKSIDIQYTHTNTAKDGQLPRISNYKLFRNGAQITTGATWSVAVVSGTITASISAAGALSVTALGTAAVVRITAVYQGTTRVFDVSVTKTTDAAPAPTGSSSGSATSVSTSSITSSSTATYGAANTATMTVKTGPNGTISFTANLEFLLSGAAAGTSAAYGKFLVRSIGGNFVDAGSEDVSSTSALNLEDADFGTTSYNPGAIYVDQVMTGLTANTDYELYLDLRNSNSARTLTFTGTATATGS